MLHRTFSALLTSTAKFTGKKNLPPTVAKEKWEGRNLGWQMKRRWVDTADVQCPIATEADYEVMLVISLNSMRFLIFLQNISDVIGT